MIELKQVSKIFEGSKDIVQALDNVTLSIQEGTITGIVGYSGAGKSTLLRLLNGLAKPTTGEVMIDGINPNQLDRKDLIAFRKKFGMIFQHFHLLWSKTVCENIELAMQLGNYPKAERERRILELLDLVGLREKKDEYPSRLSGGEKQRVGIARALANRPKYLLCDEATSALDPETTESILRLLANIRDELGVTIVLITHQMEVIQAIADRVIVMSGGQVVEENELLAILMSPIHPATKRFVKSITDTGEFPILSDQKVHRLSYIGELASQPLISKISRDYQVDVNILQGKINRTGTATYGTLYVTILGERAEEAIAYVKQQGIKVVVEHDSVE